MLRTLLLSYHCYSFPLTKSNNFPYMQVPNMGEMISSNQCLHPLFYLTGTQITILVLPPSFTEPKHSSPNQNRFCSLSVFSMANPIASNIFIAVYFCDFF